MRMIFPLLPLLFVGLSVAGVVLLTLGIRGRPIFALPRCARCKYDLRNMPFTSAEIGNCPECGANLAAPDAVTFGGWRRRPRQIVFGVVLLLLPWAVSVPLAFMARQQMIATGPGGAPAKTNAALLVGLPASVTQPWDWQELERRLRAGTLNGEELDKALNVLAAHLRQQRDAGKPREPLHWAGTFVDAAFRSGKVSPAVIQAVCQAYYGADPKLTIRSRARGGEPIQLTLNEHESWNLQGNYRCWALTDISADGKTKLAVQERYNNKSKLAGDALSGTNRDGEQHVNLVEPLPPGEHELAFTFEIGVISDQAVLRGLDGKPGTPDKWPATLARWQSVVKRKVTVLPPDQSPVALVTDAGRNPLKPSSIQVEQMIARPSSRGVELVIKWKFDRSISPIASYRVWVLAGGQKIDYGAFVVGQRGDGGFESVPSRGVAKNLPADVEMVDLLLTPDPKAAEHFTNIEEIWGQPFEIKNVPLERFDRAESTTKTSP